MHCLDILSLWIKNYIAGIVFALVVFNTALLQYLTACLVSLATAIIFHNCKDINLTFQGSFQPLLGKLVMQVFLQSRVTIGLKTLLFFIPNVKVLRCKLRAAIKKSLDFLFEN